MNEDVTTTHETSPNRTSILRVIVGIAAAGMITLVCAIAIGYFAFTQIVNTLEDGSLDEISSRFINQPAVQNRLAVISNERDIVLISPEGDEEIALTTDGRGYQFPTWSPDGQKVAFVGPAETSRFRNALYVSPASNSDVHPVYDESRSSPFYMYWAPDSESITFLTQESSGLSMRQAGLGGGENTSGLQRVMEEGAPFYWAWSPSSEKLVMHVGGSRESSPAAHISLIDNVADSERTELKLAPGSFQAPAWSQNGEYFFYVASNDAGDEHLYRTRIEDLSQLTLAEVSGFTYLTLSPTDEKLAYLESGPQDRPPFGTAYIINSDGQNKKQLTDRPVGSMFWSPDGSKVALLTLAVAEDSSTAKAAGLAAPTPQSLQLRWWVYDVATDELSPLASFVPTDDFLQVVPYFDQYYLSLTFWSPDSRYFTYTKRNPNSEGGTVWVIDTTGDEGARQVGDGTFAVWSWR